MNRLNQEALDMCVSPKITVPVAEGQDGLDMKEAVFQAAKLYTESLRDHASDADLRGSLSICECAGCTSYLHILMNALGSYEEDRKRFVGYIDNGN